MRILVLIGAVAISTLSFAETKLTTVEYIEIWKNTAVEQMQAHKIPASITLAQGILESGSGNSRLAKEAKNHFGIKCHKTWTGDTFIQDDDTKDECFRSYQSADESYTDHSLFLSRRGRYSALFQLRLDLIERYHLNQYDKMTSADLVSMKKKHKEADIKPIPKKKNNQTQVIVPKPLDQNTGVSKPNYSGGVGLVEIKESKHLVNTSLNKVKYITVKEGDTFFRIAQEFDITISQLYKYNEFNKKDVLEIGERIYISPKRTKGPRSASNYVCKTDITLREIAHEQGVKLNNLMKLNLSDNPDAIINRGSKVTLR